MKRGSKENLEIDEIKIDKDNSDSDNDDEDLVKKPQRVYKQNS